MKPGILIAIIAGVVVLIGAAAVGAFALFGAFQGDKAAAASVFPADTAVYVELDLMPSADQQEGFKAFLRSFPSLGQQVDLDDQEAVEAFIEEFMRGSGLSFKEDIGPWLGSTVAMAVVPGSSEPGFILAIASRDAAASEAAVKKLYGDEVLNRPGAIAYRDGFQLVSPTGSLDFDGPTLADNAEFTANMAALSNRGALVYWGDNAALMRVSSQIAALTGQPVVPEQQQLEGSSIATIHFANGNLAVTGRSFGAGELPYPAPAVAGNLAEILPENVVALLQLDGSGALIQWVYNNRSALFGDTIGPAEERELAELEATLRRAGIDPSTVFAELFGTQLAIAIDDSLIAAGTQASAGAQATGVAIVIAGDAGRIVELTEQLRLALGQEEFADVVIEADAARGVVYLVPDRASLEWVRSGGSLGSSPRFTTAVPDAEGTYAFIYVDAARIVELFGQMGGSASMFVSELRNLEAVSVVIRQLDGNDYESTLLITTK